MSDRTDIDPSIVTSDTGETPRGLLQNIGSKEVAFVSWIVTAGLYGYMAATWGSATTQNYQPYPEYAGVFMLFGMAVGVAMSASIVSTSGENE